MLILTLFIVSKTWKEASSQPTDLWMGKVQYLHSGSQPLRKEQSPVIYSDMDQPGGDYIKGHVTTQRHMRHKWKLTQFILFKCQIEKCLQRIDGGWEQRLMLYKQHKLTINCTCQNSFQKRLCVSAMKKCNIGCGKYAILPQSNPYTLYKCSRICSTS